MSRPRVLDNLSMSVLWGIIGSDRLTDRLSREVTEMALTPGFKECELCKGIYRDGKQKLHEMTDRHKAVVAVQERKSR